MQVIDPVCGMTIEDGKAGAVEVWKGDTFHFCSESCHQQFRAAPDRYAKKAASPERPDRSGQS